MYRRRCITAALSGKSYEPVIYDIASDAQRDGSLASLPVTRHVDGLIAIDLPIDETAAARLLKVPRFLRLLAAMIFLSGPTFPGCVLEARRVVKLDMVDDKKVDEKILAVATGDPRFEQIEDLESVDRM